MATDQELRPRDQELTGVELTGEKLGEGEYGLVVGLKMKGVRCAGKSLRSSLFSNVSLDKVKKVKDDFVNECNQHTKLHHPHIVQCFGVKNSRPDSNSSDPMLVMEYMPLSLSRCLEKYSEMPSAVKYRILLGVSSGLAYLHDHQPPIVHCDLTTNNVLLTEAMQAKIADFGVVRVIAANQGVASLTKAHSTSMHAAYMPPEALGPSPRYDKQLDIFSFGVLVIHVVLHILPMPVPTADKKGLGKVASLSEVERRASFFKDMSSESALQLLAKGCLCNDPNKRPQIADIINELEALTAKHENVPPFTQICEAAQLLNESQKAEDTHLALTYKHPTTDTTQKCFVQMILLGKSSECSLVLKPPVNMSFRGTYVKTLASGLAKAWGVATGKSGQVYVIDTSGYNSLLSIAPDGTSNTLVQSAQRYQAAPPEPTCWFPTDVTFMSEDVLIVADSGNKRLIKLKLPEHPSGEVSVLAKTEKNLFQGSRFTESPVGIGVTKQGSILVCDREYHQLAVLDSDLNLIRRVGSKGEGPNQFHHPWGIAFDSKSNVYISDCSNACIKVFTPDLEPLRTIGGPGNTPENLRAPTGICIDANDYLYVADKNHLRVIVFDPAGVFKMYFGSYGNGNGQFIKPLGIAVDEDGFVYVADGEGGRVQVFA